MSNNLPKPSPLHIAQSDQLLQRIKTKILSTGPMPFAEYMQFALYTPGLGYYSSHLEKFGPQGDFVTAPELSPLFGQCLAASFDAVLVNLTQAAILEIGAGSGKLAVDILKNIKVPISDYFIVEISEDLKIKQEETLRRHCPEHIHKIHWLDALPEKPIKGIIFGNEIIDALPLSCFEKQGQQIFERTVTWKDNQLAWQLSPADVSLASAVKALAIETSVYQSEINLSLKDWLSSLNDCLAEGLMIFIDYGFPEREYYHPQRSMGTLMCHYQHYAHSDPFFYPGLQDLTAHVNFTQIAIVAEELGLSVEGYCNQANFLIENGIEQFARNLDPVASKAVQTLLFPQEMGELFKVIILGKNYSGSPAFIKNDCQYRL